MKINKKSGAYQVTCLVLASLCAGYGFDSPSIGFAVFFFGFMLGLAFENAIAALQELTQKFHQQ